MSQVVAHTKKVHAQGMGVVSRKLCGEGQFTRTEDRDAAMKFAMNLGCVDAVTIGFKNTAERADVPKAGGRGENDAIRPVAII